MRDRIVEVLAKAGVMLDADPLDVLVEEMEKIAERYAEDHAANESYLSEGAEPSPAYTDLSARGRDLLGEALSDSETKARDSGRLGDAAELGWIATVLFA